MKKFLNFLLNCILTKSFSRGYKFSRIYSLLENLWIIFLKFAHFQNYFYLEDLFANSKVPDLEILFLNLYPRIYRIHFAQIFQGHVYENWELFEKYFQCQINFQLAGTRIHSTVWIHDYLGSIYILHLYKSLHKSSS